ncbi:MAG: hypothetical protein L3J06_00910 [Cyclobacteriaceae bacterium]|nr:hypothetical protein [Cyclobacteriaceae bacterium]
MRKFNYLLMLTAFIIVSCNVINGSEEPPPKEVINKLLINGVEDEIKFAEMVSYDKLPANKNYTFELVFHTGTTEATYQPAWSYSGIGSYFRFTLWTEDEAIASGTYTVDGMVNNNFSISKATTELNVDWSTGESDFGSYLNGSVTIKNNNDGTYQIDINCTDYQGSPVTAYYEGKFYKLEG